MQGSSGRQALKKVEVGKDSCSASTRIPIMRPKAAPMAMLGTKMPAGTLQPKEMTTRRVRRVKARKRERIMCQRSSRLEVSVLFHVRSRIRGALLAQLIVVMIAFALLKQYFHALRHVDPQKHIWITDNRCHDRKNYCLSDGVRRQVLLAEDLHLQIPLYDEGAV